MKKLPIAIQTFSKIRKEGYDKVDGCYTRDNQMPSACDEKYLNMLKEIILSIVDTKKVMVFLFGSRVSGRHSSSADADIGLLADEKLPANLYHKIRNAIDESIIPWDVDIIDFTRADQTFKEETLKDIVIWNMPEAMKKS